MARNVTGARPQRGAQSPRFYIIMLTTIVLDGLSKMWAVNALVPGVAWPSRSSLIRLELVSNAALFRGATIRGGGTTLYVVLGVAALLGVFWIAAKTPARAHNYLAAFGLILGGGTANVLEQGIVGAATDFVSFGFGIFNFADVSVVAGLAVYLWHRISDGIRQEGWKRTLLSPPLHPVIHAFLPPSLRDA